MTADPRRVQAVFLAAVQIPTYADRAAILDRECADNYLLRERVAALLDMHDRPDNALDTPVLSLEPTHRGESTGRMPGRTQALGVGTTIAGRYRLLDLLGEGGMGSVYRADQTVPVRRTVAIKLIKPGMDSKTVLARFASERQALALMDHPNIAKILDAGVIPLSEWDYEDEEQPYFVMELVEGVPIAQYCRREKLTPRQCVELFLPVCEAIQHAHQKGVIHRDLKPANVLVTKRDGRPVPIVIDFGIAKSVGTPLSEITLETGQGLFLGTFDYMAPEQAEYGSANVDTRSDVYSLGAMFYELLSGGVPYDRERLRQASIFELARIIREEEPPPPSARSNNAELRGDLDWIVMKCLDKNRDRRYAAVNALADDLNRYLRNEPVLAGPPTVRYRLGKFVRRHFGAVIACTVLLFALFGGIGGTTWGLVQAKRAETAALLDRDEKERQRVRADAEAAIAASVMQFFQNDILRQADSQFQVLTKSEPDPNLTVRAALDRSANAINRRFRDQPMAEAAIRRAIGCAYDGLGEYSKAAVHLQRSVTLYEKIFSAENDFTVAAKYDLGNVLHRLGKSAEAIPYLERALEWRRNNRGLDVRPTLAAQTNLGIAYNAVGRSDEAYQLFTDVFERAQRNDANPAATIAALHNLAWLDADRGKLDVAVQRMEALAESWSANSGAEPQKLELLNSLGQLYLRTDRTADAIRSLNDARTVALRKYSADHPTVQGIGISLSDAYLRDRQNSEAVAVLEECRARCQEKLGPNHTRTHAMTIQLAICLAEIGQLERAESLVTATLDAMGPSATNYTKACAQATLGRCRYLAGRPSEAESLVREALPVLANKRPYDWPYADARVLLGLSLTAQGRYAEAKPWLTDGYAALKRSEARLPYSARRKMPEATEALAKCDAAAPE